MPERKDDTIHVKRPSPINESRGLGSELRKGPMPNPLTDADLRAIRERLNPDPKGDCACERWPEAECLAHSPDLDESRLVALLDEVERLREALLQAHLDMRAMQYEASRHGQ